jgi:hypothetical protein
MRAESRHPPRPENDRQIRFFPADVQKERAVAEQRTILITRFTNITITPDS